MARKSELTISFTVKGNELERIYDFCDLGVAPTPTQLAKKALTYYLFSSPVAEEFRMKTISKEQRLLEHDRKIEQKRKELEQMIKEREQF